MFYGLSKFLKKTLPKQLFYRSLLIVAAPIIIMQLTISIVFFENDFIVLAISYLKTKTYFKSSINIK